MSCSHSVSKQPVSRAKWVLRSCLLSIFSALPIPFLVVVSTELEVTPSSEWSTKCKALSCQQGCLFGQICRLGSLNFNARSEENQRVCQGRAVRGSWVVSANCAAVNYLHGSEPTKVSPSHSVTDCSDLCIFMVRFLNTDSLTLVFLHA